MHVKPGPILADVKHSILATRLEIAVVGADPAGVVPKRAALRWVAIDRLETVAVSGATTKIARAVFAQRRSQALRSSASSGSSGRPNA